MKSYSDELSPPPLPSTPVTVGAGFGIRFLARFADLIYGYVLSFGSGIIAVIVLAVLSAGGHLAEDWAERLQVSGASDYAFGLLGFFIYHALAEGISGTSMGKLICGLNVVQMDGRPCTLKGGFIRDLAYHLDALFFGLIAYESMKKTLLRQRYGDVWAKTIVVKKTDFKPNPPHSTGRLVGGILLGSLALMAMQGTAVVLKVL